MYVTIAFATALPLAVIVFMLRKGSFQPTLSSESPPSPPPPSPPPSPPLPGGVHADRTRAPAATLAASPR